MEQEQKSNTIKINIAFFRKNWTWILLLTILLLGFYLRAYHINYPVIGYHNMKEAHTLGEAWSMYAGGDYFVNKIIYNTDSINPEGKHIDNLPILSWILLPLWMLFGVKLWLARLVIILFSLGSIYLTYLITKELFKREDIALLSTFLTSICPLLIFFGRNVQYDTPALFFMLSAVYFFLNWRKENSIKNFILFSSFFTLTGLTKLPFMIILIPILAIFPYNRLNIKNEKFKKKYLKQYLYGLLISIIIPLFILYSKYLNKLYSNTPSIKPFAISNLPTLLTFDFWQKVYIYATVDNFTSIGLLLALLGLFLIVFKFKKWNYRFLLFWGVSYLIYAAFSPPQMIGHNYYQIPYAPLITILAAYFLIVILNSISSIIVKKKNLKQITVIGLIILLLVIWYPSLKLSTTRQFDTQFYGLDIAGEYIQEHSQPNEVIFESGHQDRGIAWHAKRRLAEFNTVEDLKKGEEELDVSWVFIYQWGFNLIQDPEMSEYLQKHYSLAQVGFSDTPNGAQPYYFLLKKGGNFNAKDINKIMEGKQIQYKDYELTNGIIRLNYVNLMN